MSDMLLAATLIMANKIIDTSAFQELWEEIKMLDILKFAHEKGKEEGKLEGKLEATREMVLKVLKASIGVVPGYIADEVISISRPDILKSLVEQAVTCKKIEDFEKMLKLANRKPQTEEPLASYDILKALLRYTIRSSDIEDFKKVFSKILSAS